MKYLASYLLVALSGQEPTEAAVKKVLKAAGAEADAARLKSLFAAVEGKSIEELIAEGRGKMASGIAMGGGGGAAAGGAASGDAAPAPAAKEDEEEDDEEMGFGLFD